MFLPKIQKWVIISFVVIYCIIVFLSTHYLAYVTAYNYNVKTNKCVTNEQDALNTNRWSREVKKKKSREYYNAYAGFGTMMTFICVLGFYYVAKKLSDNKVNNIIIIFGIISYIFVLFSMVMLNWLVRRYNEYNTRYNDMSNKEYFPWTPMAIITTMYNIIIHLILMYLLLTFFNDGVAKLFNNPWKKAMKPVSILIDFSKKIDPIIQNIVDNIGITSEMTEELRAEFSKIPISITHSDAYVMIEEVIKNTILKKESNNNVKEINTAIIMKIVGDILLDPKTANVFTEVVFSDNKIFNLKIDKAIKIINVPENEKETIKTILKDLLNKKLRKSVFEDTLTNEISNRMSKEYNDAKQLSRQIIDVFTYGSITPKYVETGLSTIKNIFSSPDNNPTKEPL
jgi:uncharacterized membrane protein